MDAGGEGRPSRAGPLRGGGSMIVYMWAGLAMHLLVLSGLVAAVAAGAGGQTSPAAMAFACLVLAGAVLLPAAAMAGGLRRTTRALRRLGDTVGRLAGGEHTARVVPGGPAEVRDLGAAVNVLADESDRLRAALEQRARLAAVVSQTTARIRQHLEPEGVVQEAVAAIEQNLDCDHVWVTLIEGGELVNPAGNPDDRGLRQAVRDSAPVDFVEGIAALYRERASYCLQDLRSEQAQELPAPVRERLLAMGAASLLFVPVGVGQAPLGTLTLVRTGADRPWTGAEIGAAESVAAEVARGLEHARLYQEEKGLVDQLRDVDRAKSDFLAAVSHDLRSPLTAIVGYTETLGDDEDHPLTEAQRRMLAAIGRSTARLRALIEDLLTMSRIEMGAFELSMSPTDLSEVVARSVAEIRPEAADKGLAVELSEPEGALVVDGDRDQLDRVLVNLLGNAVKYTEAGGSVTVEETRADGWAAVTVRDTGIGVPDADQESLFTRFFRASNATARSIPGTGLGLAIVGAIVDNHRGEVTLRSREGEGTAVTVRLPLTSGESPTPPGDGTPQDAPGR